MNVVTSAAVLSMMVQVQSPSKVPWGGTYARTSQAIASAANNAPLIQGDDGAEKTAALIVAVAWFEGKFDQKAKGDGKCLAWDEHADVAGRPKCLRRGPPESFCTMQVHQSNFGALNVTEEQILDDVDVCVRAGLQMMHHSFHTCRDWPLAGRLNQYATGGPTCVQPLHDEGAHRVRMGLWLFGWLHRPK